MTDMSSLLDSAVRYDLGESTSPALTLGSLVDADRLAALDLGYGSSRGDETLRSLIAAESDVEAGQVLVTVGAIEAMALLARVACAPGDHALIVTPCFPPARVLPAGVTADPVPASFDDGFRLPLDRIAAALTPRTRLISLASPQNPAGVRYTTAELRALLALPGDAVVLVDETYRAAAYGKEVIPPSAASLSPRVVTCSSLSKAHGAPGLRLGWLTATDGGLYDRLRMAKFNQTISGSRVDELLGTAVLRHASDILAPRAARLRAALDELMTWARNQPLEIVRPDGGALCCARLPAGTDPAAFHAALSTRDARVAPGSWFGADDRIVRLGFGHLAPADFTEALTRLADALAEVS